MKEVKKTILWKEREPNVKVSSLQEFVFQLGLLDSIQLLNLSYRQPIILISSIVREIIHKHLIQRKIELGGLLVGNVYHLLAGNENSYAIVIRHSIPSLKFKSTAASLNLGTDVWNAARPYLAKGLMVVGWYHSHPGFGAFFSSTDRYTQKHFFKEPYHVGLVVDPFREEEMWFLGKDAIEAENKFNY